MAWTKHKAVGDTHTWARTGLDVAWAVSGQLQGAIEASPSLFVLKDSGGRDGEGRMAGAHCCWPGDPGESGHESINLGQRAGPGLESL